MVYPDCKDAYVYNTGVVGCSFTMESCVGWIEESNDRGNYNESIASRCPLYRIYNVTDGSLVKQIKKHALMNEKTKIIEEVGQVKSDLEEKLNEINSELERLNSISG